MTLGSLQSDCEVSGISPDDAKAFIREHDVDNPFLLPRLLQELCETVDWWLASWRGNPICLWPICGIGANNFRSPVLMNYIGPVVSGKVARRPVHRQYRIVHAAMTMLLRRLSKEYPVFESQLNPEVNDIRPALWFRNQTGHSVTLEPTYTAILDISPPRSVTDLVRGFSRNRRRDINNISKSGMPLQARASAADVFELYVEQLARKNARQLAISRNREVLAILSAAENNDGFMLAYRIGPELLSGFICCLSGRRTAAAVLMAASETGKHHGLPAWMILQAIRAARESNLSRFDFAGANSPVGACEKHAYGAFAHPYFILRYRTSAQAIQEKCTEAPK